MRIIRIVVCTLVRLLRTRKARSPTIFFFFLFFSFRIPDENIHKVVVVFPQSWLLHEVFKFFHDFVMCGGLWKCKHTHTLKDNRNFPKLYEYEWENCIEWGKKLARREKMREIPVFHLFGNERNFFSFFFFMKHFNFFKWSFTS